MRDLIGDGMIAIACILTFTAGVGCYLDWLLEKADEAAAIRKWREML